MAMMIVNTRGQPSPSPSSSAAAAAEDDHFQIEGGNRNRTGAPCKHYVSSYFHVIITGVLMIKVIIIVIL